MRKTVLLWIMAALTVGGTACGSAEKAEAVNESESEVKSYCAYVVSLGTDTIEVDIAEYITDEDTDRMRELNLTEGDMPDGYYIYNPDETTETLQLTKETNYTFIDWGRDFVDADLYEDLPSSTSRKNGIPGLESRYVFR